MVGYYICTLVYWWIKKIHQIEQWISLACRSILHSKSIHEDSCSWNEIKWMYVRSLESTSCSNVNKWKFHIVCLIFGIWTRQYSFLAKTTMIGSFESFLVRRGKLHWNTCCQLNAKDIALAIGVYSSMMDKRTRLAPVHRRKSVFHFTPPVTRTKNKNRKAYANE